MCFFAFFGAKIWPAAAGTGELARDLRDQTLTLGLHEHTGRKIQTRKSQAEVEARWGYASLRLVLGRIHP